MITGPLLFGPSEQREAQIADIAGHVWSRVRRTLRAALIRPPTRHGGNPDRLILALSPEEQGGGGGADRSSSANQPPWWVLLWLRHSGRPPPPDCVEAIVPRKASAGVTSLGK